MENLKKILDRCKCGVYLEVNKHRDYYETVEKSLNEEFQIDGHVRDQIGEEIIEKMIKTDTIYCLQFYPDTPIGCYVVYGHSLEYVTKKAIECLRDK
jgi:hypothetical protein